MVGTGSDKKFRRSGCVVVDCFSYPLRILLMLRKIISAISYIFRSFHEQLTRNFKWEDPKIAHQTIHSLHKPSLPSFTFKNWYASADVPPVSCVQSKGDLFRKPDCYYISKSNLLLTGIERQRSTPKYNKTQQQRISQQNVAMRNCPKFGKGM